MPNTKSFIPLRQLIVLHDRWIWIAKTEEFHNNSWIDFLSEKFRNSFCYFLRDVTMQTNWELICLTLKSAYVSSLSYSSNVLNLGQTMPHQRQSVTNQTVCTPAVYTVCFWSEISVMLSLYVSLQRWNQINYAIYQQFTEEIKKIFPHH